MQCILELHKKRIINILYNNNVRVLLNIINKKAKKV